MQLYFDFDGTLADSSPGIYTSFQFACDKLNLQAPPFQAFKNSIGPPVQLLAQRFFPNLSELDLEAFRQIFRDDYDQHHFRYCEWYEGTKRTINLLAVLPGLTLAIVTNKPTHPTIELLKIAGLHDCFQLVVGIDYRIFVGARHVFATKAEAIRLARSLLNQGDESVAFYIGDTPSDREASDECGLHFIAATYGYHHWQDSELSTIKSIDKIDDLLSLFHNAYGEAQFNLP